MVLTGYFVISPVIGALLSPSSCEYGWSAPGRADVASAKLDASVEASGPHDFTVRISAVRLRACDRSRVGARPAITFARRRCLRPPHPCPTSVTVAKRPSLGQGRRRQAGDLPRKRREIFVESGLDGKSLICPSGGQR